MRLFRSAPAAALAWLVPAAALASGAAIDGINAASSGGLPSFVPSEFGGIAGTVAEYFVPIVNSIAILVVVIAGLIAVFSQSEDQITAAKRAIIGSVAAIMLVNLAGPIQTAFTPGGMSGTGSVSFGDLGPEIIGIADWLTSAAAVVAVLMLIISGIRTVASYGSDQGLSHLKQTIFATVGGFTVIGIRLAIKESLVDTGTPGDLTSTIVAAVNVLLGFVGLLAVIVIVIAGIMMVVNIGNDDQYARARSLIIRVAIGLIVIIASAAIVNIVFGS